MMRLIQRMAGCLLACVCAIGLLQADSPGQPAAASPEPQPAGSLVWRSIGPYRGGRVTAVRGVPNQPLVYYQGPTGGGVWKTENGGLSWANISDGFFGAGSIGAIEVAESNPNVIYVGTGEACFRNNSAEGDGVYKSTDAGKTWTHVGLPETKQIGRIRIHPTNPDLVYVAALGNVFGPSQQRGVFRSKDGGKTWERVLFVSDVAGAADIAMDVSNPKVLFAGFWETRYKPWGHFSGGPGSGLYRTTDGGDTWSRITSGLPAGLTGRVGVSVSRVKPNRVWALVEAHDGGLFRSDDGGGTWAKVNDEAKIRDRPWYYSHVYADTKDVDTVYVLTLQLHKSVDGGKTFQALRGPHGDHHDLWIAPEDHQRMINSNDGGANITMDGGRSWSATDNQPTAQFYHVVTDTSFPYRVCGAQQDNTTVCIASRTSSPGIDRTDWFPVGGGESGYIAPDPKDPDVIYAGSYYGLLTRYDHRTHQLRNVSVWPDLPGGHAAADVRYRFQWTFPIVFSPVDPGALYAGANVLFRSRDEGQNWEALGGDLTRDDKKTEGPSGGELTGDNSSAHYYATIWTVAPSRREKETIWTGSDDGLVHVTRDAGKTWQNVTPKDLGDFTRISLIEASPHDAATAYLAANRYQLDDRRPLIYRTADYGRTWTLITTGIPDGAFARVVREDPVRKGLLYAGTEHGVFVSFDDGASWQSLQRNLPRVPVTDLAVKDGDLVASTQGRAFWILDDISPLRQYRPEVLSADAVLFKPRDAFRLGGGSRMPPSGAPVGQNPPSGVLVHYFLKQAPGAPITLEFLEPGGTVIKTFKSGGDERPGTADPFEEFFGGGRGPRTPPAKAGMNRFEWDMRYPDAVGPPRGVLMFGGSVRGPLAAPGSYQVRLTAGGQTSTQTFAIVKDPRLKTTDEEYRQQFDLLIKIRDRVTAAHEAVNSILKAREEIGPVLEQAKANKRYREVTLKGEELDQRLEAVLDALIQMKIRYGNDVLTYKIKLNNKLAALASVVSSADAGPTRQSIDVFELLSGQLDEQLKSLEPLLKTDLVAFQGLAKKRGLEPPPKKTAEMRKQDGSVGPGVRSGP